MNSPLPCSSLETGLETACLLASDEPLAGLPKIVEEIRVAGAIPDSEREQAAELARTSDDRNVNGIAKGLSSLYVPQVSEARVTRVTDVLKRHCPCARADARGRPLPRRPARG